MGGSLLDDETRPGQSSAAQAQDVGLVRILCVAREGAYDTSHERPLRTRTVCGVGAGGWKPLATRLGVTGTKALKIFDPKAGVFRNAYQHAWAKLFSVVKGEHKIRPAFSRQRAMGAGLSFELPANAQKRSKDFPCLRRRPLAHAAAGRRMLISTGRVSPCSSCSARTRSASTSALVIASFADAP